MRDGPDHDHQLLQFSGLGGTVIRSTQNKPSTACELMIIHLVPRPCGRPPARGCTAAHGRQPTRSAVSVHVRCRVGRTLACSYRWCPRAEPDQCSVATRHPGPRSNMRSGSCVLRHDII